MKKTMCLFVGLLVFSVMGVPAQTGFIEELSGTVEIKKPADQEFITANIGDSISQDTVISTGFRSNALIRIGSTLISVRPLTRLTLTEISESAGTENLNVSLQSGRVRVDVNPPAGARANMTIASPIATASVRGTSFWFDGSSIGVNQGTVSFSGSRGHEIAVNPGSVSTVDSANMAGNTFFIGVVSEADLTSGDSWLIHAAPPGADSASGTASFGTGAGNNAGAVGSIDVEFSF